MVFTFLNDLYKTCILHPIKIAEGGYARPGINPSVRFLWVVVCTSFIQLGKEF